MNPLVILDLETTGTDRLRADWIVQFSAIKVDREQNKILDTINEYIRPADSYVMTIGAYLTHHIHPDFLKDKPTFKDLAQKIYDFMAGCDILTYNGCSYDLPFLQHEFRRCGIEWNPTDFNCYDSYLIEMRRTSNRLEHVFKRYCGRTMEEAGLQAHDSFADVKATYAVFRHQCETEDIKPEKMITDDGYLTLGDYEGNETIMVNFGKYKGIPLDIAALVDPKYLQWALGVGLCDKSKALINQAIDKATKQKEAQPS